MVSVSRSNKEDLSIQTVPHDRCSGCGACCSACPVDAVTMEMDGDGFKYPQIKAEACTNCGLCTLSCPVVNPVHNTAGIPECFAVWANDEIRRKSSSGGAFTLLADYVLAQGGYVCGAAFDEQWGVRHIIINRKEELGRLRGSKYVQSDTGEIHRQIKDLLAQGETVLFSGCPCEVAGLNAFLRKRPVNLVTVDIFCHCTASPLIWKKYLSERFPDTTPDIVNFRDKELSGWTCMKCTVTIKGEKHVTDEYVKGFHRSLYARESCEDCLFSRLPRQGDFTIGDWWGISKYNPAFNDKKGTSLLLINTLEKGDIVAAVRENSQLFEPVPLEYIGNNGHIHDSLKLPDTRRPFLAMLREGLPFSKALNAVMNEQYDIGLVGFWYGLNYGSVLTSHALHRTVERLGYTAVQLNKPATMWSARFAAKNTMAARFTRKHSMVSERDSDFEELNKNCRMFLVGSDTVWNPRLVGKHLPFFFLDFAAPDKKKIAYASSFGRETFIVEDTLLREYVAYSCKRLDAVAVRENRGVELMRDEFGIHATRVLDPVFLLDPDDYRRLAYAGMDIHLDDEYLFSYILGVADDKINMYRRVAGEVGLPAVNFTNPNLTGEARKKHPLEIVAKDSVENWLAAIDKARLVITDSFHAVCFSIILHKDFIVTINSWDPLKARFLTLLKLLQLEDRFVYLDDDQVDIPALIKRPIDYERVEKLLVEERERSLAWLQDALQTPKAPAEHAGISTENIVAYFKREIRELGKQVRIAGNRLKPLDELSKSIHYAGQKAPSAKAHLTSSFILRQALRLEYWRCRLMSSIIPGRRKQHYRGRLRAVQLAASILLDHGAAEQRRFKFWFLSKK